MKWLITVSTLLLTATSGLASLTEEAEDFAKALFRAHKNLKQGKRTSKAAESYIAELNAHKGFFSLSKTDREKIAKRDNTIPDATFDKALEGLTKLNSQDPEIQFLLKQANGKNIKPYEQLFLYRLIGVKTKSAIAAQLIKRKTNLKALRKVFLTTKGQLNRNPAFSELILPNALKQFHDTKANSKHDWIYLGDKNLKSGTSFVLFAEPVNDATGKVQYINEDGNILNKLTLAALTQAANSKARPVEAPPKNPTPPVANNTPKTVTPDEPDSDSINGPKNPQYLTILRGGADQIIKRHRLYLKKMAQSGTKPSANEISVLRFKKGQDMYKSPDETTKHQWLYLGATHKVMHSGKRIICLTQTPVKGPYHLGYFENGSEVKVSQEQFKVILRKAAN